MEIVVKSPQGEETGRTVNLDDAVFGIKPNDHAIYLDVKQYLANQRQGTHKPKNALKLPVQTKKIKKQKGTGTARAGSIKSPVFRGGGRVFGPPSPRLLAFKLNRKLKQLARRSALSYKAQEQQITVLENLTLDAPKTKQYLDLLSGLSLSGHKSLLITKEVNKNVLLSARNLRNASVTTADRLNTYEILHANHLIINEDAVEVIQQSLAKAE